MGPQKGQLYGAEPTGMFGTPQEKGAVTAKGWEPEWLTQPCHQGGAVLSPAEHSWGSSWKEQVSLPDSQPWGRLPGPCWT